MLYRTDVLFEADFTFINIEVVIVPGFTAAPKPTNNILSVAHKNVGEYLIIVVLLELKLHHLLRVLLRHCELK